MDFNQSYYLSNISVVWCNGKRQLRKQGATIENEKFVLFVLCHIQHNCDELVFTSYCNNFVALNSAKG